MGRLWPSRQASQLAGWGRAGEPPPPLLQLSTRERTRSTAATPCRLMAWALGAEACSAGSCWREWVKVPLSPPRCEARPPRLIKEGGRILCYLDHVSDLAAESVGVAHVTLRLRLSNHQLTALVTEQGGGGRIGGLWPRLVLGGARCGGGIWIGA
jgi:hypothetical protein